MIGHRPDILQAMAQNAVRLSVVAYNERQSEIPEYNQVTPYFFTDVRSRASYCPICLTVTSNEENLLNYPGGSSPTTSVLIHEFAHALHEGGLNTLDPTFDHRLRTTYHMAMDKGLWQGGYAASNFSEYWAEGTQVWFNATEQNPVNTRSALKTYDPDLATLLTEVFGDSDWRYTPPAARTNLPHLQGFNPQDSPTFEQPPKLLKAYRQLSNPNINDGGEWVNLPPYDPFLIPILNESRTRSDHTDILFVNLSGAEVLLYWLFPDGTETLARRSDPNDAITQFTAEVGGLLLAKDSTGIPLAVFQAVEKTGRALIGPTLLLITPGLSKISGDNQKGLSGAVLANPFIIEVRDENLAVLEGISVTFTVIAGNGTLSVTSATTDENGRAQSTLTLGPNQGTNTVEVSAAGIEQTVTFNAVAEAAVDIPDANLRATVETALGVTSGAPIVSSDMATLTHLFVPNANISDLTGLEHATNLTSLWLNGNTTSDISAVAGLTNLTDLWIEQNNITDISPVAGLTNLTDLELGGNNISDISAVAGLTNLTRLGLWENNITDISPVAGLTKLIGLWLWDNAITDISPVAGLTDLTYLALGGNSISDISAVAGLTNLMELRLPGNNISYLSPLVANTGLRSGDTVNLWGNPLSYTSIKTHIPALQSRRVIVEFDNQPHPALLKISGDNQNGASFTQVSQPFVVEVQDRNGSALAGVSVKFAVTAGGGTLSVINTRTDENGRAQSTLTLGAKLGNKRC